QTVSGPQRSLMHVATRMAPSLAGAAATHEGQVTPAEATEDPATVARERSAAEQGGALGEGSVCVAPGASVIHCAKIGRSSFVMTTACSPVTTLPEPCAGAPSIDAVSVLGTTIVAFLATLLFVSFSATPASRPPSSASARAHASSARRSSRGSTRAY